MASYWRSIATATSARLIAWHAADLGYFRRGADHGTVNGAERLSLAALPSFAWLRCARPYVLRRRGNQTAAPGRDGSSLAVDTGAATHRSAAGTQAYSASSRRRFSACERRRKFGHD